MQISSILIVLSIALVACGGGGGGGGGGGADDIANPAPAQAAQNLAAQPVNDGNEVGFPPLSIAVSGTQLSAMVTLWVDRAPAAIDETKAICKSMFGIAALRPASLGLSSAIAIEAVALYQGERLVWTAPVTEVRTSDDGSTLQYRVSACEPKGLGAAPVTPVFTLLTPQGQKRLRGEETVVGMTF